MSSTPSPYYKSKRHYEEIECHSKWVSEDLIKYYKGWNSDNPILISAQTGSGKNAFILNEIIPHAISIGGSVLLLSNRVALEHQQKIEVITKLKSLGYKFRDYSEEELKETYIFGPVTVLSYHSCISKLQLSQTECIIRQYKYIVFDEAHFFISDCLFNAYSYHVLQSIIKSSPTSVHIFMTATPEEVSDKIFETEANEYETKRTQHLVSKTLICGFNERLFDGKYLTVYKFPYDFSNYNIDFFYDYSEIIERVRDEDSEKWIVFVQRKADGQKIKKQIGTKNCRYLDSTRKVETNKAWTETRNGIISKKALVCTSVIDNGISIIEPQLKNIVISAIDRTEVFQMIGRKRLSQNETVNLYFYVPTPKEISQMINHTKKLLNIVNDYTEHPHEFLYRNWSRLSDDVRKLFYVYPNGTLMLNGLVESKLKSQLNFLTDLKAEMKNYGQDAYPRKVRNWFQLPEDSGNKKNCIAAIIQMLELESVSEDEIEAFYTGIMFWYSLMPVPKIRQGKERRLASVNEALRNLSLPYKIYKREKKWWIEKEVDCRITT